MPTTAREQFMEYKTESRTIVIVIIYCKKYDEECGKAIRTSPATIIIVHFPLLSHNIVGKLNNILILISIITGWICIVQICGSI